MRFVVTLLLLVVCPAVRAAPPAEIGRAYASRPGDALERLEFAQVLATTGGFAHEAQLALEDLLDDPAVGAAAHTSLVDLCIAEPAHPGWSTTYGHLLTSRWTAASEARKTRIELRRAQIDIHDRMLRADALVALRRIAEVWPSDLEPRLAIARGLLLAGEPGQAAAAIKDDTAASLTLRAVAAVADPTTPAERLRALADMGIDPADPLYTALAKPSATARARALQAHGFTDLAAGALWPDQTPATLPERLPELLALADLLVQADRMPSAMMAYEKATRLDPHNNDARVGYAWTLWNSGKREEALGWVDQVRAGHARTMYAEHLLLEADKTQRKTDDTEAARRAYELAPDSGMVSRRYGALLLSEGRASEAMPALLVAARQSQDPDVYRMLVDAAYASDDPTRALEPLHDALALIEAAPIRQAVGDQLVRLHAAIAEDHKRDGNVDGAVQSYATAALMRPNDVGVLLGLGGLWWQLGELELAEATFLAANRLEPMNIDVIDNLIGISLSMGDIEGAQARLAAAPRGSEARLQHHRIRMEIIATLDEARRAMAAGDEDRAVAAYKSLKLLDPNYLIIGHELGDALLEADRPQDALEAYQSALQANPSNDWAILGEAKAYIELGLVTEAQDRLKLLADSTDPVLIGQVDQSSARIHRIEGDRLRAEGDDYGAFRQYVEAMNLIPDGWALSSLGWMYYEHEQYPIALAFFTEAIEVDIANQVARRGRIFSLLKMGRGGQADLEASALADEFPTKENRGLTAELRFQADYARAMAARARGDYSEARIILTAVGATRPEHPQLGAALAAVLQDEGESAQAMSRAAIVLDLDPTNELAVATLLAAANDLNQHDKAEEILRHAAEKGGGAAVSRGLRVAELELTLDKARDLAGKGQSDAAIEQLTTAEYSCRANADFLSMIGGTYVDIGQPRDGLRAFENALSLDPQSSSAVLGKAGALRAIGRSRDADEFIETQYDISRSPRIGLAYAESLAEVGRKKRARKVLDQVLEDARTMPAQQRVATDPLPVVPLPSGRPVHTFTELETEEEKQMAVDPALQGRVDTLRREMAKYHPPRFSIAPTAVARPGLAGEQFMTALGAVVGLRDLEAGPLRFSVEVLPLAVSDGEDAETGVALTGGISSSPKLPWGFRLDAGFSPAGFTGGTYFTWFGQVRAQFGDAFAGLESGRGPVTDSLTSWAGKHDPESDKAFGRSVRTWFGGYTRIPTDQRTAVAAFLRAGWIDTLQAPRVSFGEGTLSAELSLTQGKLHTLVGVEGLAFGYSQQLDGFEPGQLGSFTPELFSAINLRFRGDVEELKDNLWAGWLVSLGPQYLLGQDSIYFGAGLHVGAEMTGSLSYRTSDKVLLGLDVRYQVTFGSWYQLSLAARVDFSGGFKTARPVANQGISPTLGDVLVNSQAMRPR